MDPCYEFLRQMPVDLLIKSLLFIVKSFAPWKHARFHDCAVLAAGDAAAAAAGAAGAAAATAADPTLALPSPQRSPNASPNAGDGGGETPLASSQNSLSSSSKSMGSSGTASTFTAMRTPPPSPSREPLMSPTEPPIADLVSRPVFSDPQVLIYVEIPTVL